MDIRAVSFLCGDNFNDSKMLATLDKPQMAITALNPLTKTTGKLFSYARTSPELK